jgi:hypothetical protein
MVQRRIALLGVATMLFQAILFGWHHHELTVAAQRQPTAVHNAVRPLAPVPVEDLCEICIALHHQSAAPLAFVAPATPASIESAIKPPAAVFPKRAGKSGFRARAPPLA